MDVSTLLEQEDEKSRLLAFFLGLSVGLFRHYEQGVSSYLDELLTTSQDSEEDFRADLERWLKRSEDEYFMRSIVEDEEAFKRLFWVFERWHFSNNENSKVISRQKNIARSYDYFRKIVVPAKPGVWVNYTKDGKAVHVLDTRAGNLSFQEMRELEQSERDRLRDNHRNARNSEQDAIEEFKKHGFPYSESYQEYIRYLKNNFESMHVLRDLKITFNEIINIFIPYPFDIEQIKRGHTYIVGRSGSGKSELLKGLCTRLGTSYVLIDPHGDLADDLGIMDALSPWRIAPHEKRFVVNPFDIEDKTEENRELVAQEITNLIAELVEDSGLSRLMTTIIFPIVYTLLKLDYADFKMLTDCINPNTGKDYLKRLRHLVEPHHLAIWRELEDDTYDTSKQSVFNRLQSLLNYRLVMQTLCGRDDFSGVLEQELKHGIGAIVSLPIPTIGETVAVTLGRFFMTRMQIWAKRRAKLPKNERKPICLVVDEFHNFMSHSTAETLDQFGRKFGLFMVLAHQHIQQITDREVRGSVLANTINKIAGVSNNETRQALAREMTIDASELERLKTGHFWGSFGSATPVAFYARMVKKKHKARMVYHDSKNGSELVDGWDGFDQEQNTPTPATKGGRKSKDIPKPKFDL